ncbi:hypothetical protein KPH14_001206 [Odynerus spinipes]|uniref:Protein Wnt n=1 Tax=Odynerus spinipes TaxID=1348599 RepID=A0AAD9RQC8_9HYME|nr:hypothetical protein KPH14_001206 [Odynerus spinipes]
MLLGAHEFGTLTIALARTNPILFFRTEPTNASDHIPKKTHGERNFPKVPRCVLFQPSNPNIFENDSSERLEILVGRPPSTSKTGGYLGLEPRLSGSVQGAGGGVDGGDGQQSLGIAGAGVIGPASAERNCKSAHLSVKQQQICSRSPPVLQAVSAGTRLAIEECQHQFRSARWNCSVSPDNPDNIFGGVMLVNSREAAFVYAISAAGIAYSVTRACSRGELTDCSCDNRIRTRRPNNWQWGGCSEDIHFGDKFSREWTDGAEEPVKEGALHGVKGLAGQLMRKHDSEAGRRAVRSKMKRVCKCHGMSGSCSVRVCWRRLPAFREAGTDLAALHDGAALVRLSQRGGRRPARLRPAQPDLKRPNKTDLVYLEDSPDYCERNVTYVAMNILMNELTRCQSFKIT